MEKLTENQFQTVWTTAAYLPGYDKNFFKKLLNVLKEDGNIITEKKLSFPQPEDIKRWHQLLVGKGEKAMYDDISKTAVR